MANECKDLVERLRIINYYFFFLSYLLMFSIISTPQSQMVHGVEKVQYRKEKTQKIVNNFKIAKRQSPLSSFLEMLIVSFLFSNIK